jgi:hypothetical protein
MVMTLVARAGTEPALGAIEALGYKMIAARVMSLETLNYLRHQSSSHD